MRSDLAYAQASLDWAVSNFPAFEKRLNLWCKNNIKTVLQQTDSNATHNVIIAVEKNPLPLSFSAETGAYINAIRSSLDNVAWAIFKRDTLLHPKEVYFPVADGEADWKSGNCKGAKFIAQLGGTERGIFESLKPYRGGNDILYFLHHLDITRKHWRLLSVEHAPRQLTLIGDFRQDEFVPLNCPDGFIPGGNGETILGIWAKDAAKPKINYTPEILVSEHQIGLRSPILPLLGEISRQAQTIIKLFDYP